METRDSQPVTEGFSMTPRELMLFEAELGGWLQQPGSDEKLIKRLLQLPQARQQAYYRELQQHLMTLPALVAVTHALPVYVPPGAAGL